MELIWNGKKEMIESINLDTDKNLVLDVNSSKNIENTDNLYIEGDNLDALKLLQNEYESKIKMIYIDPPYNTGKKFVYNDKFNTHDNWLNMMYPRLVLARKLLKDDGVIFISIDDNELYNLKHICDEIFGESNFVSSLCTIMNLKGNNGQFGFAGTHEYTLVYIKDKNVISDLNGIPLSDEDKKQYSLFDEIGFYKQGATLMRTGEAGTRKQRPKGYYPIYVSKSLDRMSIDKIYNDDYEIYPKTKDGKEMSWRRSKDTLSKTISEFIIKRNGEDISFYKKQRLEEDMIKGKKPKTLFYKPEYSSSNGTNTLKKMLNDRLFDNPKPISLIKDFIIISSSGDKNDIILDFFSGSSTTAHAVMKLNSEDNGDRKFIMVQLPEETNEKSEAYKSGYTNICEIGKERIRRAGNMIEGDIDIGFKVFKVEDNI